MTVRTLRPFPPRLAVIAAAALLALCAAPLDRARAASARPLMCHGGGKMTAELMAYKGRIVVRIRFTGGKESVKAGVPGPGECRWLDRGFKKGEPRELRFGTKNYRRFSVSFGGDGMVSGFGANKWTNGAKALNTLLDGVRGAKVFYVQAKPARRLAKPRPWFDVTRIGP